MISLIRKKGSDPNKKKPLYWLQWTSISTTTKTALAKIMARNSTFSVGEVEGIMSDFSQYVCDELLSGNSVHIEGLGTFALKVKCKSSENVRQLSTEGAKVDIVFEPDGELKQRVQRESEFQIVEPRRTLAPKYRKGEQGSVTT